MSEILLLAFVEADPVYLDLKQHGVEKFSHNCGNTTSYIPLAQLVMCLPDVTQLM